MSLVAFITCFLCIVPCIPYFSFQVDKRIRPSVPYPEYTLADNLVKSELVLISFVCALSAMFPLFCNLLSDHYFITKTSSSQSSSPLHVYERYAIIIPMLFLPSLILLCRYTAPSMVDQAYICFYQVRNILVGYGLCSVIITSPSKRWSKCYIYVTYALFSMGKGIPYIMLDIMSLIMRIKFISCHKQHLRCSVGTWRRSLIFCSLHLNF